VTEPRQQLAGILAATMALLLALFDDVDRVGAEVEHILSSGPPATRAALGILANAAAQHFVRQCGSRDEAVDWCAGELTAAILAAEEGSP
jgi:hypothetical protein